MSHTCRGLLVAMEAVSNQPLRQGLTAVCGRMSSKIITIREVGQVSSPAPSSVIKIMTR